MPRISLHRVPVRAKVAVSLAVPLLAVFVFSAVEVRQAADDAAQVRREAQLARAVGGPTGLITSLQDERNFTAVEMIGFLEDNQELLSVLSYDEARAVTDSALATFRADVESQGGDVVAVYGDALDIHDELEAIRRDIDAVTGPRTLDNVPVTTELFGRYSELIQRLIDATARIPQAVDDVELRQGTQLVQLANQQNETRAIITREVAVTSLLLGGIETADEITTIAGLLSDFELNDRKIENAAGPYADVVRDHHPRELSERLVEQVEDAIATGTISDLQGFLDETTRPPEEDFPGLRNAVVEELDSRAGELTDAAAFRQRLFVGLSIGVFVLAAGMAWLVSRSITRPLRSLARQAADMAEHRLPEAVLDLLDAPLGDDVQVPQVDPMAVRTHDEVADVTKALNTVQESALDLAVEQALMRRNIADSFVNLGRRNQNLLGRQLDFITELESSETDPNTLSSLFRLDHLATRMRRNAESLLVLAGLDPPRKWVAPVRLSDVVRAAVGETEDYQRVRIDDIEPVTIIGSAAADLAHLLAELIDNALKFSSHPSHVVVRGRWEDTEHCRVEVIDEGVGMSGTALAEANRRLAGHESFMVAPSKYLGHYVAGNLAARHDIRIRLEAAHLHGIVAIVDLPAHLLTREVPTADPFATRPPTRPLAAARPADPGGPATAAPVTPPSGLQMLSPDSRRPLPRRGAPTTGSTPVVRPGGRAATSPAHAAPDRTTVPSGELLARLSDHARSIRRRSAAGGPGATPPDNPGAMTRSGLARRVRGAQLPPSEPRPLHRREHGESPTAERPAAEPPAAAPPAPAPPADEPRRGPGDHGGRRYDGPAPADDVYGFLTGFASGMQRGLDETRHNDAPS